MKPYCLNPHYSRTHCIFARIHGCCASFFPNSRGQGLCHVRGTVYKSKIDCSYFEINSNLVTTRINWHKHETFMYCNYKFISSKFQYKFYKQLIFFFPARIFFGHSDTVSYIILPLHTMLNCSFSTWSMAGVWYDIAALLLLFSVNIELQGWCTIMYMVNCTGNYLCEEMGTIVVLNTF